MANKETVKDWFDFFKYEWDNIDFGRDGEVEKFTVCLEAILKRLLHIDPITNCVLELDNARYNDQIHTIEYVEGWTTEIYYPGCTVHSHYYTSLDL